MFRSHPEMKKWAWDRNVAKTHWYCPTCREPRYKDSIIGGKFICPDCYSKLVYPLTDRVDSDAKDDWLVDAESARQAMALGMAVRRACWPAGVCVRMPIPGGLEVEGDLRPAIEDAFATDWEILS